jgi:hypothetical protein
MAHNFTYYNITDLKNDNTYISESDIQNNRFSSYLTTSNSNNDDSYLNGPVLQKKGGYSNVGNDPNLDSKLKNGEGTNLKSKLSLQERIFTTTPFLGRGVFNPNIESNLKFTKLTNVDKQITEEQYNVYVPLLKDLESDFSNSKNFIESDARKDWVRGGIHSRDPNNQYRN